jgi:hypothetical protein
MLLGQEYEKFWNFSLMCQKKYMENCLHEQWHSNNLESVPMCIVFYLVPMVGGVYIGMFEIGLAIVDDVHKYRSFIFCLIWNVKRT